MTASKANRNIFIASFLTLIAEGVGFGVRTGVLGDWSSQFGFTKTDLGTITGGGLVGFGVTIIICSFFLDRVGYKPLLVAAFILHVASALVTLAATPIYEAMGGTVAARNATYWCLYIGMFMFALANGLCEAVINPLVATLYSKAKTHYLNILHAGWPAGLVIGGLIAYFFVGNDAAIMHLRWEIPLAFFLVPTLAYGIIAVKEKFPLSEARVAGVSFGEMLSQFASPLLLLLMLIMAMVGYVELGTDSWIANITSNVIAKNAFLLFVYTSALMFVLRFFAGPIVERINPLGLLCVAAVLGAIGLTFLGFAASLITMFLAATIYAMGKTFFWPTMLGVVGERFPKGGAMVMGTVGGIGMLSAGLLGGPGIGYQQDYFASNKLRAESSATFDRYVSKEQNQFLAFPEISGLDGKKVGDLEDALAAKKKAGETLTQTEASDKDLVLGARLYGGRMALRWTAAIPATMALLYLLLIFYFRATGGYKQINLPAAVVGPTEY
jgi:MFS family permease